MLRSKKVHLGILLVLLVSFFVFQAAGCRKDPDEKSEYLYELKHSADDIEYILAWEDIISRDPDMDDPDVYEKQEIFAPKGDSGSPVGLDESQPAAWLCSRRVMKRQETDDVRGFVIFMWFFETEKDFDKHMKTANLNGMDVSEGNGVIMGMTKDPQNVCDLIIAGNRICIVISSAASSSDSHLFSIDELSDLMQTIKEKVQAIKITKIPWS